MHKNMSHQSGQNTEQTTVLINRNNMPKNETDDLKCLVKFLFSITLIITYATCYSNTTQHLITAVSQGNMGRINTTYHNDSFVIDLPDRNDCARRKKLWYGNALLHYRYLLWIFNRKSASLWTLNVTNLTCEIEENKF